MSWATTLANRPSGTPVASTTCQSWLMSSGVAVKVFMRCAASGREPGSKPKQTHKIADWEGVGQGKGVVALSPFPALRKDPQLLVAQCHLVDRDDHGGGAEIDLALVPLPGLADRVVRP